MHRAVLAGICKHSSAWWQLSWNCHQECDAGKKTRRVLVYLACQFIKYYLITAPPKKSIKCSMKCMVRKNRECVKLNSWPQIPAKDKLFPKLPIRIMCFYHLCKCNYLAFLPPLPCCLCELQENVNQSRIGASPGHWAQTLKGIYPYTAYLELLKKLKRCILPFFLNNSTGECNYNNWCKTHQEIPNKILVPRRASDFPHDSQTSEETLEHWFSFLKKMSWEEPWKNTFLLSKLSVPTQGEEQHLTSELLLLSSARAVHTTGGWGRTCSKYLLSLRYQAYTQSMPIFSDLRT